MSIVGESTLGLSLGAALCVALVFTPRPADAAGECDCDHVIEPDAATANGAELGVTPGQSVCVRGGEREFLRLYDFVGSSDAWIEIRNCEGVVEIDNDDRGYGLTAEGSRYFRITGSGDPDHEYGIRVRATRTGPDYSASGVVVSGLSSDYELDHFEVLDSGFAGFNLKTEPRCDGSANLGNFVQYDTRVHHNWIHDPRGEGIYFGSTGYGGRDYDCDGETVTLYPHEHHGVDIHHNLIEDTGWDGMQVGVSPVDCAVWANTIRDVGLEGVMWQQQGMQIGASSCEIYANRLERGPTNGIFIQISPDTVVHDNLIVDFAQTGIYANLNDAPEFDGSSYVFVHNTVLRSGKWGIAVFGPTLADNLGWNNLVLESGEADIAAANDVDWDAQGNITGVPIAELGFVDPEGGDFHLLEDSQAVGAGVPATDWSSQDRDGVERDAAAPDVGAYEYTTEPPPEEPPDDGGGGSDSGGDEAGSDGGDEAGSDGGTDSGEDAGADGEAGCGCASTGGGSGSLPLALLVFAGLLRARRRQATASAR